MGQAGAVDPCLHHLEPCISDSMSTELAEDFTAEEISTALYQMGPLKALGLDGLNEKNWEIIKTEVCNGILHILNSGSMPHDLNLTYIAWLIFTWSVWLIFAQFAYVTFCISLFQRS